MPMNRSLLALTMALLAVFPALARSDEDPEPPKKGAFVAIKTNHGTIKLELYPDKAPVTVKNFLAYVDKKFYDGLVFHRVIDSFMIQGGGYKKGMAQAKAAADVEKKGDKAIKCESDNGLSNKRGTIAMARTNVPDSATSQFFINVVDNERLDKNNASAGYCVFGKVVQGMDVVDKIKKVNTASIAGMENVPAEDVVIESVRRTSR
jgi:cyclophilin family peptidyl-prolyl cis-trans isomerase